MFIHEMASIEKKRLTEENSMIQKLLSEAPEGVLHSKKAGNSFKWYHHKADQHGRKQRVYLHRKDVEKARALAQKTYYLQKQKDNEKEIAALDAYLRRCVRDGGKSRKLRKNPVFSELLTTNDSERELEAWKAAPYEKKSAS